MMLLSSANHSRSPTYQTLQLITRGAVYKKTCADLKKHTPVCETHAEDLEGTFSGLVKKKKMCHRTSDIFGKGWSHRTRRAKEERDKLMSHHERERERERGSTGGDAFLHN